MAQHAEPLPAVSSEPQHADAPPPPTLAWLQKPSENHAFLLGIVVTILLLWAVGLYLSAIS